MSHRLCSWLKPFIVINPLLTKLKLNIIEDPWVVIQFRISVTISTSLVRIGVHLLYNSQSYKNNKTYF